MCVSNLVATNRFAKTFSKKDMSKCEYYFILLLLKNTKCFLVGQRLDLVCSD